MDQTDRRKQFEQGGGSSTRPLAIIGVVIALLGLTLAYVITTSRSDAASAVEAQSTGGDVTFAAAQFDDGVARFFTHTAPGGRQVKFFVMKSSDGVIRAAFDACDTCWEDRLGYRQEGDVMVCRKCNRSFASTDINVLQGGCNPAPIDRRVVNGRVVLSAASLNAGIAYF